LTFLESLLHQGRLRLIVQSLPIEKVESELKSSIERLWFLAAKCTHVELLSRELNRWEYNDILSQADFVILPYRQGSYRQRSSGIAFEALARGKPLVITEGLCFEAEVSAHGSAFVVPDGNPMALADGIRKLAEELPKYRTKAANAAEMFETKHSIDYLFVRLNSLFST